MDFIVTIFSYIFFLKSKTYLAVNSVITLKPVFLKNQKNLINIYSIYFFVIHASLFWNPTHPALCLRVYLNYLIAWIYLTWIVIPFIFYWWRSLLHYSNSSSFRSLLCCSFIVIAFILDNRSLDACLEKIPTRISQYMCLNVCLFLIWIKNTCIGIHYF